MISTLIATVFLASLVGSLHCAGMCGGIVALCVNGTEVTPRRSFTRWQPHAAYNFGRLLTYASLGAVSGLIGSAIDLGGSALGFSRVAIILAGGAMILIGLIALLRTRGMTFGCIRPPRFVAKLLQLGVSAARRLPPTRRSLIIGLLTGFLPCGWLYAFVIASAGTGSAALGAVTMTAFWLGTVPVMLGLGLGAQSIAGPLKKHVPALSAIALLLVGTVAVMGRLTVPAYAEQIDTQMKQMPQEGQSSTVQEQIKKMGEITLPCCSLDDSPPDR